MSKYKLKKWWWNFIKPRDWHIDLIVWELSESNPINKKITEKSKKEFLEKYYKLI